MIESLPEDPQSPPADSRSGAAAARSIGVSGRFLADDGEREPRRNLALDEAIARSPGPHPTLRLWRNARAVVLGRFQLAAAEVDLGLAARTGTPVLRRFTGGGAVYHDPGNLNVSLVLPRDRPPLAGRPEVGGLPAVYGLLLEPLAEAVRQLGLPVERTDRDLLVGRRKVSGVAAWLGRERILVHATLLVSADLEALEALLAGPGAPGQPRWERTRSRRMPVTSLVRELGRIPEPGTLAAALRRAFADRGLRFEPVDGPTEAEWALARRLLVERYGNAAWHAD